MSTPYLTIKNLSASFPHDHKHSFQVLHDVNLTINEGEFLVLLGPSGCGKSTLLRIITGMETCQHSGEIIFHSPRDLDKISFVFQDFGIFPWLTVSENVSLGLVGRNVPLPIRTKKVQGILERFGLAAFAHKKPHELSGGLKQRVGIARAFVTNPELILLDEPFSELDFFTAKHLREELVKMWQEHKTTIIMVSHYTDEAISLADHIAVFSDRPGTVRSIIKNDLSRPRDDRSAPFYALEDSILSHFSRQEM